MKLGILRALSPGYRLGVAWWLYPDEDHNQDGRHIGYLEQPEKWRQFDPDLFHALGQIVSSGQRDVRALEAANILTDAIFASEVIPANGPFGQRQHARRRWFESIQHSLEETDLVFVDPDNGLEPAGFRYGSFKAGKSILLSELQEMARPSRCLIVYHHQTRMKGGHHAEIDHWADRLRTIGFATVDALRARPYSPRVFFLLDAPPDVRQRARQMERHWNGLITWHPDKGAGGCGPVRVSSGHQTLPVASGAFVAPVEPHMEVQVPPIKFGRSRAGTTTQVGYVNKNDQEVVRSTGLAGTDHGQYVYVLRCRTCGHEYGANGSDIWLRRCPAHDRGAPGLSF